MKTIFKIVNVIAFSIISFHLFAQGSSADAYVPAAAGQHLYLDVHYLGGKVTTEAVAAAHAKDLAVEGKYGVNILKYWVNTDKGLVYCLASAPDSEALRKTHAEAHGLLPAHIYQVTEGTEAALNSQKNFYLDVHYLGAGKVSAADVAGAHQKDLAVEHKYGVNFVNYFFDEKDGVVMCLAQAKDSTSLIKTHQEAHGLLPAEVVKVTPGK